jgi:hypothetical protein
MNDETPTVCPGVVAKMPTKAAKATSALAAPADLAIGGLA